MTTAKGLQNFSKYFQLFSGNSRWDVTLRLIFQNPVTINKADHACIKGLRNFKNVQLSSVCMSTLCSSINVFKAGYNYDSLCPPILRAVLVNDY